ncbi:SLC22A4_5 [Acanthosepion pharaonis]|uniref:SLC22A4_5 n=1 Tax=Acanthosepion pharaonis TaxID=158019 RepID=A0A812AM05_ACAPH|nr:SLC22A4_5 [Sepia pharaonis]
MKYDEIIEDVGGCGLYQKFILTFLYILSVLDGLQFGSLVFIAPEINHRCAIPDLPNDTYEVQDTDHADLIKAYIPQYIEDGERKYNNCYFYSNETLDSNGTMLACNSWVYDKSQYQTSVTSDMNLVCHRAIFTSHVKTAYFVGAFSMFLIGGWISDKFGRKITIASCVLTEGISALVSSQVTNAYLFLFTRFLVAIGGAGCFGTILVYVTEIISIKYRSRPPLALYFGFPIAFIFMSLIAYFIRVWRLLVILISVPFILLALLMIWIVPESPRWLMSVKRKKQAGKILNKMAEINKCNFRYEPEHEIDISKSNGTTVKVWKIFTVRALLKKTLIFMLGWGSIIFVYYGLTLNIGVLAALYTCEHYPTCIRNSSVGFFGGFAEFVSILSPYIMGVSTLVPGRLGKSLPLMLMGIACFVSGIFIIFLPETTNKPMQDTMDEVMNNKHINNK